MHLKRIEFVGFKSFAVHTTAELAPGIVVIVGPNGSGKSNIADAVRWVLGEQSAKAVRARKSEEVIFAGSATRQPLGMAEVSLVLDNADGTIPLAFQELKVSRRLYRSGDSEYLLNGARVRLKDITEHLLHARLGPDSYSVIGQGSVDELILQRPEERRIAFDSAADVRRHALKLQETRSKLAATEANLTRVRDVIAELEPHVRRLKGQADRASRADAIRAELEDVSLRYYRHRLGEARAESRAAEQALARATSELEMAEAETATAASGSAQAESRLLELEERIHELRPRIEARREQARGAERALAVAEERATTTAEQRLRLEQEIAAQDERIEALEAEAAALRRELQAPAPTVADPEDEQARSALRRLEMELREAAELVAATRQERDAAEARIVAAEGELARGEQRLRQIEAALAVDEARSAERHERSRQIEVTLARVAADAAQLEEQLGALREQHRAADATRSAAEAAAAAARDRARAAAQEVARLHGALEGLGAPAATAAAARLPDAWRAALEGVAVMGLAADLAARIRPLDALLRGYLGRTVVVADDASARVAYQRLSAVASDGDAAWAVLSLEGALLLTSAGERSIQAAAGEGSALATWRSRLKELEGALRSAVEEGKVSEAAQSTAIEKLRAAEAEVASLAASMRDVETDQQQLRRAEATATAELGALRGALERAEREGASAAAERLAATIRSGELRGELEAARAARAGATDRLAEAEGRLVSHTAAVEEARTALAQREAIRREREAERAGRAALGERVEAELRTARQARQVAVERLRLLATRGEELVRTGSSLKVEIDRSGDVLAPLEANLAEIEEERAALFAERRAVEARTAERRAAERALRERREQSLVRAQRARDDLDRLQREVAEAADEDPTGGDGRWAGQLALALGSEAAEAHAPVDPAEVDAVRRRMAALQRDLRLMGGVSQDVLQEYHELSERHGFLARQSADLQRAMSELRSAATELEEHMREQFGGVFESVNQAFQETFILLFGGGEARLVLTNPDDLLETGIEIVARPPGKKLQGLLSLSGGERALTVVALLFGLLKVNPTPFCVLDEVDAALDEANVQRFAGLLKELSRSIQFVVVTHNRATMEIADALYGVTMDTHGVSRILSVQPREVAAGTVLAAGVR